MSIVFSFILFKQSVNQSIDNERTVRSFLDSYDEEKMTCHSMDHVSFSVINDLNCIKSNSECNKFNDERSKNIQKHQNKFVAFDFENSGCKNLEWNQVIYFSVVIPEQHGGGHISYSERLIVHSNFDRMLINLLNYRKMILIDEEVMNSLLIFLGKSYRDFVFIDRGSTGHVFKAKEIFSNNEVSCNKSIFGSKNKKINGNQ